MGEADFAQSQTSQACRETIRHYEQVVDESLRVQTPGGVFEVQWSSEGKATAMGQLAFFAEFLQASDLFGNWLQSCPLRYTSPNAPLVRGVLGSWMLGILDGQYRYAHIGTLRGDGVAPEVLGMSKIIGDHSTSTQVQTQCRRTCGPTSPGAPSRAMDAGAIAPLNRTSHQNRLDTGLRHHRQSALRPPRRCGRELPATSSTPTGSVTCDWCLMPSCKPVTGTAPRMGEMASKP